MENIFACQNINIGICSVVQTIIYRLLSLLSNNYFRFEYRLKVKADAACQIQIFNGYTKKDRW